jgi:hypothetical protein
MERGDRKDIIGGTLMTLVGIAVAAYSASHYQLGQLFRMGPGMMPVILGTTLAALGLLIAIPAFFRSGSPIEIDGRPSVAILGSIAAFALLVTPFGIVPAILGLTLAAAFADDFNWVRTAILAVSLSVAAVLIFTVGLGIPMTVARWPF